MVEIIDKRKTKNKINFNETLNIEIINSSVFTINGKYILISKKDNVFMWHLQAYTTLTAAEKIMAEDIVNQLLKQLTGKTFLNE